MFHDLPSREFRTESPRAVIESGIGFMRRQASVIASFVALALAVGLLYLWFATPGFTANGVLLVEPRKMSVMQESVLGELAVDPALVESQIQVMQSPAVLDSAIADLGLTRLPPKDSGVRARLLGAIEQMTDQRGQLFSWIKHALAPPAPADERQRIALLREALEKRLEIQRVGLTYAVNVAYQSANPEFAAQIVNAIIRAYLSEQVRSRQQVARGAADWLRSRLDELKGQVSQAEKALLEGRTRNQSDPIAIRELESNATTYRTLYDEFLKRYTETAQQESLSIATDARLVSAATPPFRPSYPNVPFVLATMLSIGCVLGLGSAFLREFSDDAYRTPDLLAADTKLRCLAVIPSIRTRGTWAKFRQAATAPGGIDQVTRSRSAGMKSLTAEYRGLRRSLEWIEQAISPSDGRKSGVVIGIVSSQRGEGKSFVSARLGAFLSMSGSHAVLLDCDFDNPTLSKTFARGAQVGLLDVLNGRKGLTEVAWEETGSGLMFIPQGDGTSAHGSKILSSEEMIRCIDGLRREFRFVIVDLAALGTDPDAIAAAAFIDSYIYLVEWGETPRELVLKTISSSNIIYEKIAGTALNKVNIKKFRTYDRRSLALLRDRKK